MYFVCCKILGIEPGSDEETIKAAYRKSAKELHPDRNDSEKAGEYFTILNNAYEYLLTHSYNDKEIEILWQQRQRKTKTKTNQTNPVHAHRNVYHHPSKAERYTLREVLQESRTARTIYIAFHFLFLFVGIWLMYYSVHNVFFHSPHESSDIFSAYFAVIFGFFIGLLLTSVFLITGISYIRNR